jgi:hypothetical protein
MVFWNFEPWASQILLFHQNSIVLTNFKSMGKWLRIKNGLWSTFYFSFLEAGFCCVAQADLNSTTFYLCLLSAGITVLYKHALLWSNFNRIQSACPNRWKIKVNCRVLEFILSLFSGSLRPGYLGYFQSLSQGDESEGIWLMGFMYIYEIEWWNLLQLL